MRPDPNEIRLVLVRHGESVAQVEGVLSGHDTCRGLSPAGRAQAEALRDRLLASGELGTVDAVYTSILPRTIETAEIMSPVLDGIVPTAECEWCEIHVGEAEGITWETFQSRYEAFGDPEDPTRELIPRAETWSDFYSRIGGRLDRLVSEHRGECVVVVCHGGVIGAVFAHLDDSPLREAHRGMRGLTDDLANTSLSEWRLTGDEWQLVRYNDAAHLA
jgi:probable phosphoglycerate mutase